MQYMRLALVVIIILIAHSIAGAETNVLYNVEMLYPKMYSVNPEKFVKEELGGKTPTYYCNYPCSTQIHIIFFKKGQKVEWVWSRNSDWYQYENRLDLTGMIVRYDENRQIIGLSNTIFEMEREIHTQVVNAPEVKEQELRKDTRKLLKKMHKGEDD